MLHRKVGRKNPLPEFKRKKLLGPPNQRNRTFLGLCCMVCIFCAFFGGGRCDVRGGFSAPVWFAFSRPFFPAVRRIFLAVRFPGGSMSKFFQTTKKGETLELKEELNSESKDKQKNAIKKVITEDPARAPPPRMVPPAESPSRLSGFLGMLYPPSLNDPSCCCL